MAKFALLLRGINVGGKNKVPMAELTGVIEQAGARNVSTYINSGNVFFDDDRSPDDLKNILEKAIEDHFGFNVVCGVFAAEDVALAVGSAPSWWGENDDKHNALFIISPMTPEEIAVGIGKAKPEYEKIAICGPIIFWSAPLKTFSKTRYSKIVGSKYYPFITIRNENTTREITKRLGV